MTWGIVQVGRLILRETYTAESKYNQNTGASSISLAGQESTPPLTRAELMQRREDITAMVGTFVPIVFENKPELSGYYMVQDSGASLVHWTMASDVSGRELGYFDWILQLTGIGSDNAVDIESRVFAPGRDNDFSQAGTTWHAPSGGAYGYTPPSSGTVSRETSDGPVTVYLGLQAGRTPRWAAFIEDYGNGRVRFFDGDGLERSGVGLRIPDGWTLDNGLIQVDSDMNISAYVSGGMGTAAQSINVSRGVSGGPGMAFDAVSVIRNDYEMVIVRAMDTRSPSGRTLVDITLRRGSRFLELFLQTDSSSILGISTAVAEAGTAPASSGYVRSTNDNVAGHKLIVGSARSFTANTGHVGLWKNNVTELDAYVGYIVPGTASPSGEAATDLQAQYIGAMAETTTGVRR